MEYTPINAALAHNLCPFKVGDGVSICLWSDRHAATVIAVSPSGKTITVQQDTARRTDRNGLSESQSYVYERNPNGSIETFRKTKRGWRSPSGHALAPGRAEYYDPSF